MLGLAQQAGHELTQDAGDADVLVVNTCAFIDSAKQESIDAILEMAQHKKDGACQRLIVTGCLAERYRERAAQRDPGNRRRARHGEVPEIVRAISGGSAAGASPLTFFRAGRRTSAPEHPGALAPHLRTKHCALPISTTPTRRACWRRRGTTPTSRLPKAAITSARSASSRRCAAHYRSRPAESIVREARALAARGVKELLLISQDTTFYGVDRQERGALARLLRELNAVDGLEWIRLLYLYPTTIDDDDAGGDGRLREGLQLHRSAAAARVEPRAEAHEAPGHAADLRRAARAASATGSPASRSDHLHRRLSRRDRGGRRRALRVRPRPRVRSRGRVHLLARRGHLGLLPSTTTSRRRPKRRGASASWRSKSGSSPRGSAAGSASGFAPWSMDLRASTSSCCGDDFRRRRPTSTPPCISPNAIPRATSPAILPRLRSWMPGNTTSSQPSGLGAAAADHLCYNFGFGAWV